ncbi:response regulator transcription factor [Variovorax sp. NFACC27]|uniref:response regulator n=1 Tax=unclassified Variovorax TaxID=663243 RepID=UPI00089C905F|nr:DNA-binding NarL/FixJ family response regulator [Variovorax paradoxus]SEF30532.1 two component transcriptional regulator, LuxR family [Variovorax sp. NFACC28]SEG87291.1 two component transcriptional regulator, LuxR family [Variovorax sp. NFACC29]SFD29228.1 two component transcriptional regulator, LuxR family [Variovorax sp. NFACC26]SFG33338.1 two component transcriptional regulator, LuxR family [Variovorax sp. NFACC27]
MPTVLLIDDHAMFREGLALTLRQEDASLVIETAGSGAEALAVLANMPSAPELVMTDFYLPDLAGAALLGSLRRCRAGLRILVLSASEDPQDVETAIAEGAHGFVHKSADSRQLMDALRRVMQGQHGVVLASPGGPASMPILSDRADPLARLSARQTEVLHLLCEGLRNADIAARLSTTERTVKAHISAIFGALEVDSRTQAVIAARRAGLMGRPR